MNYVKLEDICNITTGKYDANHGENGGDYHFYTCAIEPIKCPTFSFEGECIILPGNGANVGEVLYHNGKFEAYQRTYVLQNLHANPRFVYYQLKSRWKKYISNKQYGSATNYIRYNNIAEFQIPMLSLEEQKKIAQILDKADEIRTKKRLANDKLDEFLKSTFISMFGTPIANEKHWEVKKLKELTTKIMSGNTPKGGSQVYVPSGIEFYRSQNVWKNRIEKDDIAYIDEATHKKMERSSLKHNDILITKTGRINTENSSLGRSALYEGEDDKANINGHVYLVRLKEGMCHRFILTILTSNEYREHIRSVCVGGIDKRQLNKEHIEDFPIIYPPIEDQNKFAQIVEKVEAQKQKNELVIEQMNNLFNSLSQRAFKGEL